MATEGEEVAEDYRLALEDLSANSRHEISTLTVIARENTEHALAIADVLQQHILKTSPNKKLTALYLLDSIVKNVGTPYTLYFGRNLFKIFMESYAVVDPPIRRKMEEMLKTWKEPVVNSLDTRPPFSPELIRPIENALMKVRAATMPQPQQQGYMMARSRSAMTPHRSTPTPPAMRGPGGPPGNFPSQPYSQNGYPQNGSRHELGPGQPYPGQPQQAPYYPPPTTPQAHSTTPFQPPGFNPYGPSGLAAPAGAGVENLSKDIQHLIVAMRVELAQNPHDPSVQTRYKALQDLQGVVSTTSLPPDQLQLIRSRVNELAAVAMRAPPAQIPAYFAPAPVPLPLQQARLPSATPTPQPAVTLDGLLGPGALATLLQRQSATPQNSTPVPPPYANVAIRSPKPTHVEPPRPVAAPTQTPLSLLDKLRAAGMLPPAPAGGAVAPPPAAANAVPPNIASLLAGAKQQGLLAPLGAPADPGLDASALKHQFRPDALAALYDDLGPACTQCGRRFKTDPEGKQKKIAHMDWHFRVHSRSSEAEKRGTHRSWYVDQEDWLQSREIVDSDNVARSEERAAARAHKAAEAAKPKYIRVPDARSGINTMCPICQERFENKWLDTDQEWVWFDAMLVGNRAYHATCYEEAKRDREGSTPRKTPEPVLGKRKAETGLASPKVRSLKTSA